MSLLTYGQLLRSTDVDDAPRADAVDLAPAPVRVPWRVLAQLAVVILGASLGGIAANALLDDPGAHVMVVNAATGSAGAVLATLTAYLFVRRMHRTLAVQDVVLSAALTVLALANAASAVLPNLHGASERATAHLAIVMGASMILASGLLFSAAGPGRTLGNIRRTDAVYVSVLVGAVALVGGAAIVLSVMDGAVSVEAGRPLAITALGVLTALCALAAAVAFLRAAATGRDPVTIWLVAAASIIAVANLSSALFPWGSEAMVSGGDVVQLAGWFALLVAGIRDFEWAHRRRAEDAVLDERRRMARDLHDGLAQELAYLTTETRRLVGHPSAEHLAKAAERALEESRAAILALTRPVDEPLERTIVVEAQSIGSRAGVDVTVAVRPGLDAPAEVRQALLRILREAMGNAVRHGGAATVHVSIDGPSPLVMAIADDGSGFDLGAARRPDSLGLQSMQDRAANLGGALSIESVVGEGTTVAMVVP